MISDLYESRHGMFLINIILSECQYWSLTKYISPLKSQAIRCKLGEGERYAWIVTDTANYAGYKCFLILCVSSQHGRKKNRRFSMTKQFLYVVTRFIYTHEF